MRFLTAGRGARLGVAACGRRGDPRYEPPKMLRNALPPPRGTCVRQRGPVGSGPVCWEGTGLEMLRLPGCRRQGPFPARFPPAPLRGVGAAAALLAPGARRQPRKRPSAWKSPRSWAQHLQPAASDGPCTLCWVLGLWLRQPWPPPGPYIRSSAAGPWVPAWLWGAAASFSRQAGAGGEQLLGSSRKKTGCSGHRANPAETGACVGFWGLCAWGLGG